MMGTPNLYNMGAAIAVGVALGLPLDAHADLNVLNMNGSFSSELPITAKDGSPSGRVFRAKLGTGGGEILVRTVNGGIHLFLEGPRPS